MHEGTTVKLRLWLRLSLVLLVGVALAFLPIQAQNAGLGTSSPDASALFELSATDRGFLVPRMTTGQRDLITLPAPALLIFNVTDSEFQFNFGTAASPDWQTLITADAVTNGFWAIDGNASTNPANDYVGTSDAQPLVLRTNDVERVRILANGNLGVGTNNPLSLLSVGSTSQFQVSSTGAIVSAAGITSAGNIDFTALNAGGLVSAAAGTGRLTLAVAGTDYESPLVFSNGMQRLGNDIGLGGSLTSNTVIANAGFNLVLSGAGRLGVGVTSPVVKVDVDGAIRIGDAATATSGVIRWSGTDFEGHDGTQWQSLTSGGGVGGSGWDLDGNTATNASFLGTLNSQDLRIRVNNVQRAVVTTGGSVGIGLTAPQQQLDIAGALRLGNTAVSTSGSLRWTGTDFEGHDGTGWVSLTRSNTGWTVTGNTISPGDYLGTINAQDLPIRTNGVERLRVSSSGNIGIATTSPTVELDVNGSVRFGTRGTTVANVIKMTVNADFGNLGSDGSRIETITVPGARVGSSVHVSPAGHLPVGFIIGYAFVSADDTVEIKLVNVGLASGNPAAQDYYVTVIE